MPSPAIKTIARFTGLFTLLTIAAGVFAQTYVSNQLINFKDAASTAANIAGQPGLVRLGFAAYMVEMASQIASTALFYELLRPVGLGINLVTAFLSLAGCVIKALSRVFFIAPLLVLGGVMPDLEVFSAPQIQALSLVLLGINDWGAAMALIFFGLSTTLRGCLILRSAFLPRPLGALTIVAGIGCLLFLYPPVGYRLFPLIAGVGLMGSAATVFWLLVFGVDEERWRARSSAR